MRISKQINLQTDAIGVARAIGLLNATMRNATMPADIDLGSMRVKLSMST